MKLVRYELSFGLFEGLLFGYRNYPMWEEGKIDHVVYLGIFDEYTCTEKVLYTRFDKKVRLAARASSTGERKEILKRLLLHLPTEKKKEKFRIFRFSIFRFQNFQLQIFQNII